MSRVKNIRAISFDGDMTLWDFEKVMLHSLTLTLAELRSRVPGRASVNLTLDQMIEIRNRVAIELKGEDLTLEEIRYHSFKRITELIGSADKNLASDLNALYMKHRFEDIELYSDVIPVFDLLPAKFMVGLVSNGNGYPERCGLPDRFHFTVLSQDVGVEKPHAPIFIEACKQAGCSPCELLHVGDSLEADVTGANNVGALTVWLNRNAKQNKSDIVPDYEIRSLTELISIFESKE